MNEESTPNPAEPSLPTAGQLFPNTLWPLVEEASRADDDPRATDALRQLCVMYREPIVQRLRRHGHVHDAEDLAHGFMEFLLEKNRLRNFVRGNTKFRSYLLTCLNSFLRDEWRKRTAQKRGSGEESVPFDDNQAAPAESTAAFDRQFAWELHARTMAKLAGEQSGKPAGERFGELKRYVLGVDGALSYAELAAKLGMTEGSVTVAILRLRRRYSDFFRAEVIETVSREEVDEEMRYLITLLADSDTTVGSA